MDQQEKRNYLIQKLLDEEPQYRGTTIPKSETEQKKLLRSLMNVRPPKQVGGDFLEVQDQYLKEEIAAAGITELNQLEPADGDLYLWRGDITLLKCGAVVNAANSGMTGCYAPCHLCIDNCIHTFAGVQLRLECAELMEKQGYPEPTGQAKITKAYNLPCDFVIHTVGPIIKGVVTEKEERLLASCYTSCLTVADEYNVGSIAFCCISTGVFSFPKKRAAEIAVKTVREYKEQTGSSIKVIFNVFNGEDYEIYDRLLK